MTLTTIIHGALSRSNSLTLSLVTDHPREGRSCSSREQQSEVDEAPHSPSNSSRGPAIVRSSELSIIQRLTLIYCRTLSGAETVITGRHATEEILHGHDDRLVVVVGCVLCFQRKIYEIHLVQTMFGAQCRIRPRICPQAQGIRRRSP